MGGMVVLWLLFIPSPGFFHPLPPYNLWALRKVMLCPVNVERELVWGHLTYSCRLVLVCGAIGRGPQVIKNLNTERWISNFRNIRENCRVSEIKWLLESQPHWGQEQNKRAVCPPVIWSQSSLDRIELSLLINTLRRLWSPWMTLTHPAGAAEK